MGGLPPRAGESCVQHHRHILPPLLLDPVSDLLSAQLHVFLFLSFSISVISLWASQSCRQFYLTPHTDTSVCVSLFLISLCASLRFRVFYLSHETDTSVCVAVCVSVCVCVCVCVFECA